MEQQASNTGQTYYYGATTPALTRLGAWQQVSVALGLGGRWAFNPAHATCRWRTGQMGCSSLDGARRAWGRSSIGKEFCK